MWQYFDSYWHIQFSLEANIPLDADLLYGGKKITMRNSVAYQTDISVSLCRQSTFSSQQAVLLTGEDIHHYFLNNNMWNDNNVIALKQAEFVH